jgi:hypothetical protein
MTLKKSSIAVLFLTSTLLFSSQEQPKPKLVLQITVDQLRGDLPDKYTTPRKSNNFLESLILKRVKLNNKKEKVKI